MYIIPLALLFTIKMPMEFYTLFKLCQALKYFNWVETVVKVYFQISLSSKS